MGKWSRCHLGDCRKNKTNPRAGCAFFLSFHCKAMIDFHAIIGCENPNRTATAPAPTARCRAPKSLQPDKPRAEQCSSARCDARSASWRPKIAPENWRPVRPPSNGGLSLGDDGTRMRFPPCRTEPAVILAGLCEQGVTPNAHSLCQATGWKLNL